MKEMTEPVFKEEHPYITLEVQQVDDTQEFVGTLSYFGNQNGKLVGPTLGSIQNQFQAICSLVDEQGGMLRVGTIMLGYHNREFKGDVLLPDGEIIGSWNSDDEEWCYFTKNGDDEYCLTAPSPWLLQDALADWLAGHTEEDGD